MLIAKNYRLATFGEIKGKNVLVSWIFERNFSRCIFCEHWRRADFIDFTSFRESLADQNGIDLITALLSNHELKGFPEVLNLLSKAEKINLFKAVVDFCLAKTSPLASTGTMIYKWIHSKKWAKKDFVFSVKGATSVRNKQDEIMLNISVFTIGRKMQFFNWHKFKIFSERHQLIKSSFEWFDSNQDYACRALEKFCPALHLRLLFFAGASAWFRESLFLIFQLEPSADALMFAEQCWKTNMAQSHSSI